MIKFIWLTWNQVRDSISASSFQSLSEFTYDLAMKYKRGGYGEGLEHGFMIHNVILVSH